MAKYSTDFSGYTADAQPSDWTLRYETVAGQVLTRTKVGSIGGKVMRIEAHTDNAALIGAAWDAIDSDAGRDDFEILCVYVMVSRDAVAVNAVGRASGTDRASATFAGAQHAGNYSNANQKRAIKRVSGSHSTIQSSSYTAVAGRRMAVRTRMNGTTLSVKIWQYDLESEPETFPLGGTVSDVTAAGWVGIFVGAVVSDNSKGPVDVEYVAVGTDGDTADLPGAESTPVAFTGTVPTLNGTEGISFAEGLSGYFSGTETPFAYAVHAGTLPAGLSLNAGTGVISGTPTTAGTSSGIVIRATDDAADTADTNAFDIVIAAPGTIVKGVRVTTTAASETGITAMWWDSNPPTGNPVFSTATASTDGAGVLELDLDATTALDVGQHGTLVLYKLDGTDHQDSLGAITRLTIEDIA